MKRVFLLVLFLSGCSSKFYLEIFNNSEFPLIVYAENEVAINPGEHKKVRFFTSTKFMTTSWNGVLYRYDINVSHIPGKYMVSGWVHSVKLQVEGNLEAYILKPEFDYSTVRNIPDVQPIGFPITPKLISKKSE